MSTPRIFHNARIATNASPYFAEAILVEDGRISAVGTNDEIMRQKASSTEVVDLGRTNRYSWVERFAPAHYPWRASLQS